MKSRESTSKKVAETETYDEDKEIVNIRYPFHKRSRPVRYGYDEVDDVPLYFEDIKNRFDENHWKNAINEEFNSLNENKTWTVVLERSDMKLIGTQWIFKVKEELNEHRY